MEAIGLVPWVRRTNQEQQAEVATTAEPNIEHDTKSAPVLQGNLNAKLLLAFTHWPLEQADSALLDGMLRAIGLSLSDVCTVSVDSVTELDTLSIAPPLTHGLFFGSTQVAKDAIEPSTMELRNDQLNGWQLPSLATLREQPQRKRQAWITLKSLRASLDRY
jgi:DNA polymerase III psi subunit